MSNSKKTILILAANPKNAQREYLDAEVKRIAAGLQKANSDHYQVVSEWAVSFEAMYQALLQYEPAIVQFSGYGEGEQGIVLENVDGLATPLNHQALTTLFKFLAGSVELVLFSACYVSAQAAAVQSYIETVIGIDIPDDEAASRFAVAFYTALAHGRPVKLAYEFGCVAMDSFGTGETLTQPVFHQHQAEKPEQINIKTVNDSAFADKTSLTVVEKVKLSSQFKKYYDKNTIKGFFYELDINAGELESKSLDELINELIKHSLNQDKFSQLLKLAAESCPNPAETWQIETAAPHEQAVIHQHQRQPVATANPAPELTQLSVYLALVTDDLYPARRQIEEHLRSFGVRVLPEQEEAWQVGLQQADLYVQLLSGVAARDPAPNPAEQAQEAESCQVERLLWRDNQLLLEDVPNAKQRALLAGSAVMASELESFKRYLTQRLETWVAEKRKAKTAVQQALAQSEASGGNLVFINNAPEDQDFAQTLAELLGAEGHSTFLPISGGELSPRELIEDLEGNLQDCDLIILPYRHASPVWVRQQLRNCVKAQAARGKPHRFIALCYCPSQQGKPSLSTTLSNLKHIDFPKTDDQSSLTALLQEVC